MSFNRRAEQRALRRWDELTKPRGSLGKLEAVAARVAGITGDPIPWRGRSPRKLLVVAAADHGVVAEGVAAYPQEVTRQMVVNFLRGRAAVNHLCAHVGAEVVVADAGVAAPVWKVPRKTSAGGAGPFLSWVRPARASCRVRAGTANFAREPAMTRGQARRSLEMGRALLRAIRRKREPDLLGVGEMGIGNTTAASALTAVFTGAPVRRVTGPGADLHRAGVGRKIRVIERALALHRPNRKDPVGCLAAVGGLEIGLLAGVILEAVGRRLPVVLDGFIATAAALVAAGLDRSVAQGLIASHCSREPGHRIQLEALGLEPLLDLRMRLGEGTGAALGMGLVEAALKLLAGMPTFAEAGVSDK